MKRITEVVNGREVDLETYDGYEPALARKILAGETYPIVPTIPNARTILDVGANVGATSVLFVCHYPDATIHSFEPGPATFEVLSRNVARFPNVHSHKFGLFDKTDTRPLYHGRNAPGQASINPDWNVRGTFDVVQLEHAGSWLAANGVESIDVLKVDTEGCELPIFHSVGDRLADVQVIYFEAHSEEDWRELDSMLAPTHVMGVGRVFHFVSKWEFMFVRRDLATQVQESLAARLEPSRDIGD